MTRSNRWHTERRIKAAVAAPLRDELDSDSDRPGAYAVTREDEADETDIWDPTDQSGGPMFDISSSSARHSLADADPLQMTLASPHQQFDNNKFLDEARLIPHTKRCVERKWLIALGIVALCAIAGVTVRFALLANNARNNSSNSNKTPISTITSKSAECDELLISIENDVQTDPFRQCSCFGTIVMTDRVLKTYKQLKDYPVLVDHYGQLADATSCQDPANKALVWMAAERAEEGNIVKFQRAYNRLILGTVFAAMGGDYWFRKANWFLDSQEHECIWWGVSCNENGDIVSLSLLANNLTGTIESRIGLLTDLKELNFDSNELVGSIPMEVWNLPNLQILSIQRNNLSGHLPATSLGGQLSPSLQILKLNENPIIGPFPSLSGLSNLEDLDLSETWLEGPFPSFAGLTILRQLSLSATSASHEIQDDDWIDLGALEVLSLNYIQDLIGTLPSSLTSMTSLSVFEILDSYIEGTLPSNIGNLANLEHLSISGSKISGTIPPSIGNCSRLKVLKAESINLNGTLPTELNNLLELRSMLVASTYLSGTLPSASEDLEELDITKTNILIPSGICDREKPPKIITLLSCDCCTQMR